MRKFAYIIYPAVTLLILVLLIGIGTGRIHFSFFPSSNQPANQESPTISENSNSQNPVSDISVSSQNENKSFSFAVLGDTQSFRTTDPDGALEQAVSSLTGKNFDFAFAMGDLISSCDNKESCIKKFDKWKKVVAPILSKIYEIQGNHDRTGGDISDAAWQEEFNLPTNGPENFSELTYSFDYGNSHFVVLDSSKPNEHVINEAQRNWLDQDLSANTKDNSFVLLHDTAFPMSQEVPHGLDVIPKERDLFWDILKKHGVTAVINGHLHMTARKKQDNIYQFVVGDTDSTSDDIPQKDLTDFGLTGHHYAIFSVEGRMIGVKTYSVDGNLENDFSFTH